MTRHPFEFIGFILLGLGVLYIGIQVFEAWFDTVYAPKVDMFNCSKHGLIPKHLCIKFEEVQTPGSTQEYHCPFCYEDAYHRAQKTLSEKERIRL